MSLELTDCQSARAEPDRRPDSEEAVGSKPVSEIVLHYVSQIIIFDRDIKPTPAKIEAVS